MHTLATALLFIAIGAAPAGAQELTAAVSTYGSFGIDDLDGGMPISLEVRVSIPFSDRFAFEPFFTAGASQLPRGGLEGFYGGQIRQRIARLTASDRFAFVTYGAGGYYYSGNGLGPPIGGLFGFGLHQRVSARVAFRPEIQLVSFHIVPVGTRLVAGISLDLER